MPKGFFTQCLTILLSKPAKLDDVCHCLSAYGIAKRVESSENPEFSGDSVVIKYKPHVNGYVSLDCFPSKWPDHMGDPKGESMLFATWSMGHFGPFAYPWGLKRAIEQSWRWDGAKEGVERHVGLLRLRMSYIFGAGGDAPVMPEDYDPQDELIFLTGMASALAALDGAICCYNPNGEVLVPFPALVESLEYHAKHQIPPLDLWANVRLFNIDESWLLMDSVGNSQLDTIDHEVAFPRSLVAPGDVDRFIRNASLYLLGKGDVIKEGDTMDGPANTKWQAMRLEGGLSDPPREVIRWLPFGINGIPKALLPQSNDPPAPKKPLWKIW